MAGSILGMANKQHRDGYEIGMEHRRAALAWVNRFGGLTARQLARLVWRDLPSGMRMAQRVLQDLKRRGFILHRGLPNGGAVYVLNESGARFLRASGEKNVSARGHRDLKFEKPFHRMIANEFAIDQHFKNQRIWPEFEVQRRYAPVPDIFVENRPKIPDLVTEAHDYYHWIEVENAFKSQKRLRAMVAVANRLFDGVESGFTKGDGEGGHYCKMIFVAADPKRLLAVLRCFHKALRHKTTTLDVIYHVELVLVEMSPRYRWGGVVGTVDAKAFLLTYDELYDTREAILDLLQHGELQFDKLNDAKLWQLCAQGFKIEGLSLDEISQALDQEITAYEQLQHLPSDISARLKRDWMTGYLRRLEDKALNIHVGFTTEFLSKHMVAPAAP